MINILVLLLSIAIMCLAIGWAFGRIAAGGASFFLATLVACLVGLRLAKASHLSASLLVMAVAVAIGAASYKLYENHVAESQRKAAESQRLDVTGRVVVNWRGPLDTTHSGSFTLPGVSGFQEAAMTFQVTDEYPGQGACAGGHHPHRNNWVGEQSAGWGDDRPVHRRGAINGPDHTRGRRGTGRHGQGAEHAVQRLRGALPRHGRHRSARSSITNPGDPTLPSSPVARSGASPSLPWQPFSIITLSGCWSSSPSSTATSSPVQPSPEDTFFTNPFTIGVKYDQPGFGTDTQTDYEGFDPTLGRELGSALHFTPTFVGVNDEDRETMLDRGQLKLVIASYSITQDREDGGPGMPPPVDFAAPICNRLRGCSS